MRENVFVAIPVFLRGAKVQTYISLIHFQILADIRQDLKCQQT